MDLNRRDLLILGALTLLPGCKKHEELAADESVAPGTHELVRPRLVDAGPIATFSKDGVYDLRREQGVFVVRRDGKIWAFSSVYTHRGCKVKVQPDDSFLCPCHDSAYDRDGKVLSGPAPRDLPRLAVASSAQQHLLVNRDKEIGIQTPNRSVDSRSL